MLGFSPFLVTVVTLNPCHLLDPAAVFCDPCVDTRPVLATAAISPTHHSSKEHAPIALSGSHWPTWVTLAGEREIFCTILRNKFMTCIWMWKTTIKNFHFTWQASTPPLNTPAQIMRGVVPSSISLLHTALLIMRTSAFCNTDATSSRAGRRHFLSLLTHFYIIIYIIITLITSYFVLNDIQYVGTFSHYMVWTNIATLPVLPVLF